MKLPLLLLLAGLLACTLTAARADAPAQPVPIEHFFDHPAFSSPALSSDARSGKP